MENTVANHTLQKEKLHARKLIHKPCFSYWCIATVVGYSYVGTYKAVLILWYMYVRMGACVAT